MSTQEYSYNATLVNEPGINRMRFELGDTLVDGGADTCALTDTEIGAALEVHRASWKRAKLMLLESICMRFAYEVDTKVGPLSYSLGERAERWKQMAKELKQELSASSAPILPPSYQSGCPYFYSGMMDNPPALPPGDTRDKGGGKR